MIISSQYETGPHSITKVDLVNPDHRPTLGDFVIRFGSTNVYLMRDQLLTLLHECETAIHHDNEIAEKQAEVDALTATL